MKEAEQWSAGRPRPALSFAPRRVSRILFP